MRQNILLIVLLLMIGLSVTVCDKTPTAPDHSNPLDPKHGPPKILSVAPDSAAKDLPADTAIVVRFDDVMDTKTFTETTFKVQHTLDNQTLSLKGTFTFGQTSGQNIASVARFAPERFYLYNNTISVSLVGIKDVEGNDLMAVKNNWNFTTYPLTQVSQLKLFAAGQAFRDGGMLTISAGSTADLKLFGYKSATDSLNVTATVTWKPAPNLSVPPSTTARLIVGSKNELSPLTACIYNKNGSGKLDSVCMTVQIDTRGPAAPDLKTPNDGDNFNDKTPTFEWNSVTGAIRYVIVVDNNADFLSPVVTDSTAILNYTAKNDLSDDTYNWRVLSVSNLGNRGAPSKARKFTIDTIKPDKVTLKSPSVMQQTNETMPVFMWSAVSAAAAYEFEVDNNADFSSPVQRVELNALMFKVTVALSPDGIYLWHVRAKDAAGNLGDWSDSRQIIIDTTPPSSPVLRMPDDNSETNDNTPEFDWDDAAGASFYEIQVDNTANFSSLEVADLTLETSVFVVPDTKALKDSTYNWRVRSRDAAGNNSEWAGPRRVIIKTQKPATPQPITPENGKAIKDNTPVFDWSTVPGSGIKYDLQVDNNANFLSAEINLQNLPNSQHEVEIPLSEGVQYWRVRARDAAGNESLWSSSSPPPAVIIDTIIPTAPMLTAPVNTEVNISRPTFEWTPVTDATTITYDLQATKTLTAPSTPDFTRLEIDQPGLSSSTFTALNALTDAVYYWQVRARDAANNIGPWANFRSFTLYEPPPDQPALVSPPNNGSPLTNNKPKLDWSDVIGVIGVNRGLGFYELQATDSVGPNNGAIFSNFDIDATPVNQSEFQVTTALPNGIYIWRVRGKDLTSNFLDWAVIVKWVFTIDAPFPANPYLIAPNNGQTDVSTTPTFDWSNVNGANSYELQVTKTLAGGVPDFSALAIDQPDLAQSQYTVESAEALTSSTVYYWRVRAKQDGTADPGPWSSLRKLTVQ